MSWENDDVVQAAPARPATSAASWEADEGVTPAPQAAAATESTTAEPAGAAEPRPARGVLGQLSRQVGLTARHGLEGLGQAAEVVTEPVRRLVTDPAARALVAESESVPTGRLAERFADTLGLPKPETAQERVVGDAARFMAGAAGMAGASNKVAQAVTPVAQQVLGQSAAQASKGTLQAAAEVMAANPGAQIAGAAGAGAGSGMAREAGGDGLAQGVAGLAGGLAGSMAAGIGCWRSATMWRCQSRRRKRGAWG